MNSNPALISLENIAIEFPKQESSGVIRIVNGLSFQLPKGDIACLLGPSGCGKSTVLRAICGFEPVQAGEIKIHGKTVSSPSIRISPAERKVGMVFQDFALFPHLSVLENVMFGLRTGTAAERERVGIQWLERVALADKASAYPHELSGGQQQRLCIARALARNPEILLLDEPTSALDPIATSAIEDLIHELKGQVTIIIVTHNMQQAARVSDYVSYMYLGEQIEFGATKQIFTSPTKKETENYITGRFG